MTDMVEYMSQYCVFCKHSHITGPFVVVCRCQPLFFSVSMRTYTSLIAPNLIQYKHEFHLTIIASYYKELS
jgi:hypothetical protein